ncbi:MAG: S-ribosylhomocysteine lyase [Oscillospiraceae bacterium]|jgi:S-ribosylhomocysteine lyase|nr:S-ribosylhomocysteine lyase [Oscillospiraceae bacterium]
MEKIASFCVDHSKIDEGMYISRIDDDITTYDIRVIKPNTPPFLECSAVHTIEHLFATFARNSRFGSRVVYFGPMGCRTGFYLLTRNLPHVDAIGLTQAAFEFIDNFGGEIPGCTKEECGNFLEHDLAAAKKYSTKMTRVLKNWSVDLLQYQTT